MATQEKINELFETFEALADREEYYVQILESNPSEDEKRRAKFFLTNTRETLKNVTNELETLGYAPLKVWAWYDGKEVEW